VGIGSLPAEIYELNRGNFIWYLAEKQRLTNASLKLSRIYQQV